MLLEGPGKVPATLATGIYNGKMQYKDISDKL